MGKIIAKPLCRMLNITQVADAIGSKPSLARKKMASGEIPSVLVSGGSRRRMLRVRSTDLEQWLAEREVRQGA